MKRFVLSGLGAAGLAVVAACSSMITGGELIRAGEPTGTIRVINETGYGMDAVLISECGASTYGLNRLPPNTAIPNGGYYDFSVSAGCWDVAGGVVGVGDARERLTVPAGGIFEYTIGPT